MRNCVQLLKPGGSLQWTENDTAWSTRYAVREAPPPNSQGGQFVPTFATAFRRCWNNVFGVAGRAEAMLYGFSHLERLFTDPSIGNLRNVFVDAYSTDALPHLRKEFTLMCVAASKSIMQGIFGDHLPGEDRVHIVDWEADMLKDVDRGVYIRMHCCTFVGTRKENV